MLDNNNRFTKFYITFCALIINVTFLILIIFPYVLFHQNHLVVPAFTIEVAALLNYVKSYLLRKWYRMFRYVAFDTFRTTRTIHMGNIIMLDIVPKM